MTTEETAREMQREYTESVWNQGDVEKVDGYFHDDVVVHDLPAGEEYEGLAAFKQWIEEVRAGFPDFDVGVEDVIAGDDRIVARWVASGTHEGELPELGLDPTGESATWEGVTIYELDGEMVTEAWWYYDMMTILTQLGVVPEEMPA